jgi:hypothetical protein
MKNHQIKIKLSFKIAPNGEPRYTIEQITGSITVTPYGYSAKRVGDVIDEKEAHTLNENRFNLVTVIPSK